MEVNKFEVKKVIIATDLDELNHVNNVTYVQWIQDIAQLHWKELTKSLAEDNCVWVVIKHEIEYVRQAILGDEVTIQTWVGETKGVKSVRHVAFYKGSELLVNAITTWCLLDSKTLRPTRISEELKKVMNII